jgi:protein-S-isoprenylcysteine O-methyltransferase Ste14
MSRPVLALLLFLLYTAVAFGVRSVQQKRRTGSTGFVGISGRPFSLAWFGGVLFVLALALAPLAAVLELAGLVAPLLDPPAWMSELGEQVIVLGVLLTFAAQLGMGDSWRIGVRESERTTLVTGGAFALVRNPIFSAMLLTAVGFLLLLPNPVALASLAALLLAVELQVRGVEEPYLLRTHGAAYRDYAARVGRFVPGLGRMS